MHDTTRVHMSMQPCILTCNSSILKWRSETSWHDDVLICWGNGEAVLFHMEWWPTKDGFADGTLLPKSTYDPRTCRIATVKILAETCIAMDGNMIYVTQIKVCKLLQTFLFSLALRGVLGLVITPN